MDDTSGRLCSVTSWNRCMSYPQSPNLCEPATVSDAIVVGGGGTDVTCCQVGTKICCARADQDCWSAKKQSCITAESGCTLKVNSELLSHVVISPLLNDSQKWLIYIKWKTFQWSKHTNHLKLTFHISTYSVILSAYLPVWWLQVWFVWAGLRVLVWLMAQRPPCEQSNLLV